LLSGICFNKCLIYSALDYESSLYHSKDGAVKENGETSGMIGEMEFIQCKTDYVGVDDDRS